MDLKESTQKYHHNFSAAAHNQAMDIFYSENPNSEALQSLIELAHVAHWHWTKREDKTPQNISVALWVLSRAYSANGYGERALVYAEASLATIKNEDLLPSFYGYSHEALARAHLVLGNTDKAKDFLSIAYDISEKVPNKQAKEYLLDQLNRVKL